MKKQIFFLLILVLFLQTNLFYSQNDSPKVTVEKISDSFYKFYLNDFVSLLAFVGPDGVLLVDSGFEDTAKKVKSFLDEQGHHEIKYIINTHSDYDHIAGNRFLRGNALVFAHKNGREQMLKYIEPSFELPFDKKIYEEGLPEITSEDRLTIHFNGEKIHIIPLLGGHTDEDIIVHFEKQGLVCLGDMVMSDSFPVVKVDNGGSVAKLLANLDTLISRFSNEVQLVVSHGRDMKVEELKEYREMVEKTADIVSSAMKAGKGIEDMKKENILADWEKWNSKLFPKDLNTDSWIETIVKSLKNPSL
jgi:glyoxylase-like metal-dependent hydrolase (beta-lactamase superfamily II)